jgi:hypothetical protein
VRWLTRFLRDELPGYLRRRDVTGVDDDLDAIREATDEIGTAVADGLAWAREPWPDVEHDERGMATALV